MSMSVSAGPAKKKGRKFSAPSPEINVTPLVDVMLVLLIIFMITVQAAKDSIPVELPDAPGTSDNANAEKTFEITLDARSDLHVGNQSVQLELAEQELPRLLKGHEKDSVTLSADKRLPYEKVVKVVAAIRDAGVETINLSVQGE